MLDIMLHGFWYPASLLIVVSFSLVTSSLPSLGHSSARVYFLSLCVWGRNKTGFTLHRHIGHKNCGKICKDCAIIENCSLLVPFHTQCCDTFTCNDSDCGSLFIMLYSQGKLPGWTVLNMNDLVHILWCIIVWIANKHLGKWPSWKRKLSWWINVICFVFTQII